MEVKPADIAENEQILDVFANDRARGVTYCVFEINGEVRVVRNKSGVHAEVEVINILKANMKGILGRNERITLYMNYSPCTVDGSGTEHKCADNIRKLKIIKDNKGLQLTIIYANFYLYYNEDNKEGIISLIKNCLTLNTFTMNDWIKLKALLVRWYGAEIVPESVTTNVPESVTTNGDFYLLYGGRKENDKRQNTRLEVLKQKELKEKDEDIEKQKKEIKKLKDQKKEVNKELKEKDKDIEKQDKKIEKQKKEIKKLKDQEKKVNKELKEKDEDIDEKIKELEIAGGHQHEDEVI